MDECPAEVAEYFHYVPLQVLHWSHLAFSVASIVIVTYTILFHLHKSWFEGVFKETLYTLYIFILWHSVFTVIFAVVHIFAYVNASTPCEMLIDRKFCVLRIIASMPFTSFVLLHAAVTLQRVITTFSGNTTLHRICARCFLLLIFAQAVAYQFLGFHGYPLVGKTPMCPGYVHGYEENLLFGTFVMMMIDVVNVLISLLLMAYNRRKVRQLSGASLEVKFRNRQTLKSVQQILPCAFFHLFCFIAQYVGFGYSLPLDLPEAQHETLTNFFYMMPYYCCICPALLLWLTIIERNRKKKKMQFIKTMAGASAERHFAALLKQWEIPQPSSNPDKKTHVYKETRENREATE